MKVKITNFRIMQESEVINMGATIIGFVERDEYGNGMDFVPTFPSEYNSERAKR